MDLSQYVNLGLTPESQEFYRNLSAEGASLGTEAGANAPLPLEQRRAALEQLHAAMKPAPPPSWHTEGRIILSPRQALRPII